MNIKFSKYLSERIIVGGFSVAIGLLCMVGWASYLSLQNVLTNRAWGRYTYQVLVNLAQVESSLESVGNDYLRYSLTRTDADLKNYQNRELETKAALLALQQLTQDNLVQQQRLDELEKSIDTWFEYLKKSTRQFPANAPIPLHQAALLLADKRPLNQEIKMQLSEMKRAEKNLLQKRIFEVDNSIQNTLVAIGVGYALSFGLLFGVYFLLRQQIRDRTQAERLLQAVNAQLAHQMQETIDINQILQKEIADRIEIEQTLKQTSTALQRSNQELEQFAYVASHDLQEPLRAVTSYTQLLAQTFQGSLDEKTGKYVYYVVDGATRMQQLINDLLEYSRVGKQSLNITSIDCNSLLEKVLQSLQAAITESRGTVTIDRLPTVIADSARLGLLFQNLIGNAIKYAGDSPPEVTISATQSPTEWIFSVRDNGIGIEPQYLERIFVLFQRLHTRRRYTGTGIGLAICRKVAEIHHGRIWVESQLGQGATFYFSLPIVPNLSKEILP